MNIIRSEPIAIQHNAEARRPSLTLGSQGSFRSPRERHDTITRIKDSFNSQHRNGQSESPHLSSPTPPTFIPDGSHQASRIGDYLLVEQVEGHNSGNVFRAINTNNELEFICKVYDQHRYGEAIAAYSKIEPHPNINHVVDVVIGTSKAYVFFQPGVPQEIKQEKIAADKKQAGFLADNLHNVTRTQQRLSEEDAATYFTQVAKAVAHCHDSNIVIRDLKLRKFIFRDSDRSQVMLESIEDSVVLDSEEDEAVVVRHGCVAYISPETLASSAAALSGKDHTVKTLTGYLAKASDIWSMGVMLYTMLLGRYPFQESEPSALFSKISRAKFSMPESLSSEARDLIHNLLRRDPSERFRARDILQHPWVKKNGRCWDSPRFVMPLGAGGDIRCPRQTDSSSSFQAVVSQRDTLSSFACHYADQVVPDSYVSAEDETMFE